MIGQLKGQIISKNPPEVLLEVGGIGYELLCPMSTFLPTKQFIRRHFTLHSFKY